MIDMNKMREDNLLWAVFIAWMYSMEPQAGIAVLAYLLFCELGSIKRKI